MQDWFDERQDALRTKGCSNADIAVITTMNRIQRVVNQCRVNHGGPISSKEELQTLVDTIQDEKALGKILDLEVRYRKFTMTKNDCPLFQQRKLSNQQKIENISLLMESQDLGLRALATMDDLLKAIGDNNHLEDQETSPDPESNPQQNECDFAEQVLSTRLSPLDTVAKDEFILGMFEDGFYPGQVVKDCNDKVDAIFMKQATFQNVSKPLYWKWTPQTDRHTIKKICVLKIRPNIDIAVECSTRRCIIYKLLNLELIEKFVS